MAVKFAQHSLKLLGINHQLPHENISSGKLIDALRTRCGVITAKKAEIVARKLGINGRHLVRDLTKATCLPSPSSIDLSISALNEALLQANLTMNDIDYLLSHTCTPHTQVPPNAAWIADKQGFQGPYLELRQACTGFANALQIASAFCKVNQQPLAVVGCETGSVYFDMSPDFIDKAQLVNFVQMGDGAAAVILGPNTDESRGGFGVISDIYLGQIGENKQPGFHLDGGSADVGNKDMARFHHNIAAVRSQGSQLFELGLAALMSRGHHIEDMKYILPHQANGHIDKLLAEALNIDSGRIINDAQFLGNLGSAAIWVSLSRLIHSGKLIKGDKVMVLGAEATKYLYGGFIYKH
ncbi:3-oxoacyl-ACP synthase III family protein [Shewanella donghaensis]|uniref:3-oxoacyl-ACP synthase III family protein n=1 Tax=Shewanella donghaensis TaxID=238836 RepID=UPI00118303FD|nr:3-oxoacyl-[acyl-carrier-protein] synthase III C-terminal domain-containing protein [Shewanella donghaensis]